MQLNGTIIQAGDLVWACVQVMARQKPGALRLGCPINLFVTADILARNNRKSTREIDNNKTGHCIVHAARTGHTMFDSSGITAIRRSTS